VEEEDTMEATCFYDVVLSAISEDQLPIEDAIMD
jgi:hypothetical protein